MPFQKEPVFPPKWKDKGKGKTSGGKGKAYLAQEEGSTDREGQTWMAGKIEEESSATPAIRTNIDAISKEPIYQVNDKTAGEDPE